MYRLRLAPLAWLTMIGLSPAAMAGHVETLKSTIDIQQQADNAAYYSQQKIDGLTEETDEMLRDYRRTLRQIDSLKVYNEQLDKLVLSQQNELTALQQQMRDIDTTQRDIVPLMLKMVEVIVQFVALDLPFLPTERQQRIAALTTLMDRADVSLAEKYRRILEAYQVETEYGRTIEAYQDELTIDNTQRTVDVLRIGRLGLYYLTLDQQQAGVWQAGQWQPLATTEIANIQQALKVAKKQSPPDLLVLPLDTTGVMKK